MIGFVSEVPDSNESATAFANFSSNLNPVFARSFSSTSTVDTPTTYLPPMTHANFVDSSTETPQNFMSLAQLSREYSSYLLLNQSGFDHQAIMAATAFQKAFPLIPTAQGSIAPNSLTSLLPYASMLSLMAGFDSSNLLGNLHVLQAAANALTGSDSQHQLNDQLQVPFPIGASSAATCASSVVEPSESPVNNETNNNVQVTEGLLTKQQFIQLPTTPSSSSPFNMDESLQNSISKNKLGRSYNPGRPLAMADRQRILDLYKKGYKISHIARIIGVTHSCVSKIMTRYRRTGSMHPRSAQIPRKNSFNSSPTRSSSSPLSGTENCSSMELSDSASSTCSFLVPQTPVAAPQTSSPTYFNATPANSTTSNATTNEPISSLLIHKPVPLKSSVYCASD